MTMKKLITITVAFLAIVSMNAQELCSFNPNNELGLGSDFNYNTTLYAGKIIGKTNSIVCTVGANDMYQSWSYSFSAGNGFIKGGLQGQTNPTDVNGEKPSKTLLPPVNGAFLSFEAKADGWLSVLLFASSHKAYTVFEDGKAIGYTFGAIGNASSDLGAVYQFAIQGEGQNNEVKNPIEFAEQEFLKATAPSKYNARWSWDAEGNMTWNQIKINGRGVIKFHVKKGGKYIVNANGSKMTAVGFCFDTHGNTVIKADGTTILPAGTGFYNKRTIHVATAGTLPNLISNYEKNLIEELTLTGYLNGTDIACIRRMAGAPLNYDWTWGGPLEEEERGQVYGKLAVLDISGATIVSGGDYYYKGWADLDRQREYSGVEKFYTSNNTISNSMFEDCKFIKLFLPNNITTIEGGGFTGSYNGGIVNCKRLTEIVIPQSVTSIGSGAFGGCSSLTSIKVESGNQMYDSRNNCNAIIDKSTKTIVAGCKNTIIPSSVTSIGYEAFGGCSGLTSITIPSSITSIDNNAFYGCSGLISVDIPNGVTFIGYSAFYGCSGLTSVTIPNSVTSIGGSAFLGCSGLTSVTIPNSVTSIEWGIFRDCTSLTSVTIPNSVTSIGSCAFYNCSGLTSVTIPNSVTSIGSSAFDGCSGLTSVNISDLAAWCNIGFEYGSNPLSYAHHLYINGNEITNLVIPSDVTSISSYAFSGCSGLTSVTIPNSVESIGYNAFSGCSNMTSVNISDLAAWCNIKFSFYNYECNPLYYAHHLYINGNEITNLVIPNSVESIGYSAFSGCSGLTSVTIPNSVKSIGYYAFVDCTGLTSVNIPNSVTFIDSNAFSGCSGLTSVTIPNGVISIDDSAFSGCSGLISVTIPNSVTRIGSSAFKNCNRLNTILSLNSTPPSVYGTNNPYYYPFYSVDKKKCVVWVPRGCVAAYKNANPWKDFSNFKEIIDGDVNLDGEVNQADLDATVDFILDKDPEGFYESLADLNGDDKVDAADVVKLVTIQNLQEGLNMDLQAKYSNQVISSLSCTLNNDGDKAIQLTKCELYCNQSLVGSSKFKVTLAPGGSKKCSFDELESLSTRTGFSVVWYYTYNGEDYTYCCEIEE